MALAIVLTASLTVPTLADTTSGNIIGQVTSNGQPVSGVAVTAVAPSGRYSARTDAKGSFSILGVQPDTYTVTFTVNGYNDATVNGVTVNAAQTTSVNQPITSALKTIGSTTSRSTGISAFQPQQPTDTYSVNSAQINTLLGKPHATSEADLLVSLPGASLDRLGYPVLRGGRENDEGFQFEGIDYTDAFTSQFVNALAINGVQNFQLTPGAGDASVGNAGTGQINITVKRGARPAFASFEGDLLAPTYLHQFAGEYGFATPNGRFSNYISFTGSNQGEQQGRLHQNLLAIGQVQPRSYEREDDLINNAVWKFGKDNHQTLQFLIQNQRNTFRFDNTFQGPVFYRTNDPLFLLFATGQSGLTAPEIQRIVGLGYHQSTPVQLLDRPGSVVNEPNSTFKLQYSNSLNASTYFTVKAYKVNATAIFDNPFDDPGAAYAPGFPGDVFSLQGGQRSGTAFDLTKQLGSRHLLGLGAKYEFVHPIDTFQDNTIGFFSTFGSGEVYDFLSNNPSSPRYGPSCATTLAAAFGANPCGYLDAFFPNGAPRIPSYNQSPTANRHDLAWYVSDQFQATDKLKINLGLRFDGTSFDIPRLTDGAFLPASGNGYSSAYYFPTATRFDAAGNPVAAGDRLTDGGNAARRPSALQPRFGVAYQFTPHDSVTFSYGRSVELPAISFVDARTPRAPLAPFAGIPATANVCGPTGDRACRDYADQLFWDIQNPNAGVPVTAVKAETFNNFDASYQHDFGHGLAVKINPFYRRGYDVYALAATAKIVNGQPVFDGNGTPQLNPATTTNLGSQRTTGVEFYLTKTAVYGLSGSLSMTYLNEFSNVVPTSVNEDFFPSVDPASLALGNQYRAGFISPFSATAAVQYKWRSGWRLNPIISFNRGYPYGSGLLTAGLFGGTYANVPNTNVTNSVATGGSPGAPSYVDPANPGVVFHPNVAAGRGTPEGNSAGQYLTAPRINTDVSLEYNRPGTRSTFGTLVTNLFNNVYSLPSLNGRYQPVATGISGPKSGSTSFAANSAFGPNYGFLNYSPLRSPTQPYLITPSRQPTEFRFYYQYAL